MRIDFHGRLKDEPEIRAGFIGCGSHAFRNIYPCFQFAPVDLVAVCDLDLPRAQAFAKKFGAQKAYANHQEMLEKEKLDAIFIVTNYDEKGRPRYPKLASDTLNAGCHVWIEKPPSASCAELEALHTEATQHNKIVMAGLKKMFMPAVAKAKELANAPNFGGINLLSLQYPQGIPETSAFEKYFSGQNEGSVVSFLDHLCHPGAILVSLLGLPKSLHYQRTPNGAGIATFKFESGAVASLFMSFALSSNGGLERTLICGPKGGHIQIENNIRLRQHKTPPKLGYGDSPSYFTGEAGEVTSEWEPEFSLGQLYNKQIFLQGYQVEVEEFARNILDKKQPKRGHLLHAWQVTKLFESFAAGPNREIEIAPPPEALRKLGEYV